MESKRRSTLLKNKSYLWLISSQIVSSLGDWLDILAVMTLVAIKWNASPIAVSALMLCFAGPMIVVGPIAGSIADKFDRKKIMIISDILSAIAVLGVAFSTSLWQVYVLITLKSIFVAFFMPAKNGKLKEIVDPEDIQMATGISGMIDNGAKVIGPTISGLLVASVGVQWAFFLDAISFVLSALFLIAVPKTAIQSTNDITATSKLSLQELSSTMKEGFAILKGFPILLTSLFLFSASLFVLQIADTQFMVLARLIFEEPTTLVGYAMAASGVGMFVSSAILTKIKLPNVLVTTSLGGIGVGGAFALVALMTRLDITLIYLLFPLLCFIAGASFGLTAIPFQISVQKQVPISKTGRVFGTIGSITTISSFIGMGLGGVLSQTIGVIQTFVLAGVLLICVGTLMLISKRSVESRGHHVTESDGGI
ncbi:MFS transporter [Bacillus suaedaesalsae]|uniref:MFS transporter n=1 Tax=Bacillus suaedaesalsae TaxID=2810349 RepID=A0ABS2DJJ3_9BACI|nr:MFS transporter [Bacillus suaedaesalsae]MBM6618667.1 MFS transporter [Bacillus suaedaesalsae]